MTRALSGLILAAGAGTRFGPRPKLLAQLDGRPLLEYAVGAQCAVPELDPVVVVLGAFADEILDGVEFGRARPVVCDGWREGQAASLRCGLGQLPHAESVIVTLGDEPLITAEIIRRFLDQPPGSRATYGGRPGHPVVLGPEHRRRISTLTGDQGARPVLGDGLRIECGGLSPGSDVDTPEDLEAMGHEARAVI